MHEYTQRVLNIPIIEQRTEEWYNLRENLLTASDVPTVIGDNKYKSKKKLLKEKCNLCMKFKGNKATEHGQRYESIALKKYEETYKDKCYETGLYIHPRYTWLGCSPDGITDSGILIEIKCPLYREIKHEVPECYKGQIQVQLECMDMDTCAFVQYKPAMNNKEEEFDVVMVQRDRKWFADKLPILQEFWDQVIKTRNQTIEIHLKT